MSKPQLLKSPDLHKTNRPDLRRALKSLLMTVPVMLWLFMVITGGALPTEVNALISGALTLVFLSTLFFLMIYTGKTYKYRTIFFVALAVCFIPAFMTSIIETRGSLALTGEDMLRGDTPFCHLVIPMVIIPAALTRTIIFPGSLLAGFATISSMMVIWIGATVALGRAWCSWACFYGGLDDGFSHVLRRPLIKKIDPRWTLLPYAVLTAIVLTSAATLSPTYCEWLCPFKAVTEFEAVTSFKTLIQTIIFVTLFLILVIILPILTKRRTQCGLFCPFAAFQSWFNKINIFEIRVNDKCIKCGKCLRICPTFSLDEASLEKGRTLITCTKCGRCVDECPVQAVSYQIKGTPIGINPTAARNLFLYPAYMFGATLGAGMIQGALFRLLKLVTTGSMI